jgi:hypothetical protein
MILNSQKNVLNGIKYKRIIKFNPIYLIEIEQQI